MAAALAEGRRKRGCCQTRSMVTLDIDNAQSGTTEDLCQTVEGLGCDYLIYSTRKHNPQHPRIRIIIPIDRPVSADECVRCDCRAATYPAYPAERYHNPG